jgi:hypothetical protein
MSRPLRFIPDPKTLVEVSTRTVHSRLLLRPSQEINEIVAGIMGRAQRLYKMEICAVAFVSSHFLCGAAHKKCYGEWSVMWSWRAAGSEIASLQILHST